MVGASSGAPNGCEGPVVVSGLGHRGVGGVMRERAADVGYERRCGGIILELDLGFGGGGGGGGAIPGAGIVSPAGGSARGGSPGSVL